MPLENEMQTPKDFRGKTGKINYLTLAIFYSLRKNYYLTLLSNTGILNRAMVIIVALYILLGITGYIRYGADVQSTITVNLPAEDV